MTYEASIIITTLEKFNTLLNISLILKNEINNGKKSIQNIEINIKKFQKIIDTLKMPPSEHNEIDKNSLEQVSICLQKIIKNLNIVKKIMHVAARRHVAYTDNLENKKNNYHA